MNVQSGNNGPSCGGDGWWWVVVVGGGGGWWWWLWVVVVVGVGYSEDTVRVHWGTVRVQLGYSGIQ